ncbi:MAG: SdrD B-like domain-containing protein [Gammaproteobacteria bacterium]
MKKSIALPGALTVLFLAFAFSITAHAGAIYPPSIGDFVWNDLDGDGIQDGGEPGLEDIVVNLCDSNASNTVDCSVSTNLFATTTTDASGNYLFTQGTDYPGGGGSPYFVVEIDLTTVPSGFIPTTPTSLFFDTGNNAAPITTADFGFQVVPVPAAAWLFGSGLLGLLGMARRKRAVQIKWPVLH